MNIHISTTSTQQRSTRTLYCSHYHSLISSVSGFDVVDDHCVGGDIYTGDI